jgi:hypothetical protein
MRLRAAAAEQYGGHAMAQTIRFLTPRTLLLVGVGGSCAIAAWSLRAPMANSELFSTSAEDESGSEGSARSGRADGVAANATRSANTRTQHNGAEESARPGTRRTQPGRPNDDDSHDGSEQSEEAAPTQTAEGSERGANEEGSIWSRVKRSMFGGEAGTNGSTGIAVLVPGAAAVPGTNGKVAEVPWNPAATNTARNGTPTGKHGTALSGAGALESACDKCRETNCRHYLDTDLVEACFEQVNPEHGADVSDRLFLRSCQDVMACAHSTGCAYGALGPAPCYCGSANVDTCTTEGPAADAPCRSRWQVATRTDDHALILNRMSDAAYPSGWAFALLECEREFCRDACSP